MFTPALELLKAICDPTEKGKKALPLGLTIALVFVTVVTATNQAVGEKVPRQTLAPRPEQNSINRSVDLGAVSVGKITRERGGTISAFIAPGNYSGGIQPYWDQNCIREVSSIDWGTVKPGSEENVTMYVRNEGIVCTSLSITTEDWNPSSSSSYMKLYWDYTGQTTNPSKVCEITLILTVFANVSGIEEFDCNVLILGDATEHSQTIVAEGLIEYDSTRFEIGVNYGSLNDEYSLQYTSPDILRRDFSKFRRDGIDVISLSLFWHRLEGPNRGEYNDDYLDRIKQIIHIARQYDIEVLMDFHTIYRESWCTPDYVIDPVTGDNDALAVSRSNDMRQAFIDMLNHTVQYLAGTEGIWAWSVQNEPWYWPRKLPPPFENIDQKENLIELFEQCSGIVRTFDRRPVTVRFISASKYKNKTVENLFAEDWGWDPRIFDALDFISFNAHIPTNQTLHKNWIEVVKRNVLDCVHRGKSVWITEFGYRSDDDTVQAQKYEETLSVFRHLPISGWIAWFWQSDNKGLDKHGLPGQGNNTCSNALTGEGRQAYHVLVRSKNWTRQTCPGPYPSNDPLCERNFYRSVHGLC